MLFSFHQHLPGHKRAPSDASVGSSEDEKLPQSPSILESVPEKIEETATPKSPVDSVTTGKTSEEETTTVKVAENHIQDATVPENEEQAVEVSPKKSEEPKTDEPEVVAPETVQAEETPAKPDGDKQEEEVKATTVEPTEDQQEVEVVERKEPMGNGELIKEQVPAADVTSLEKPVEETTKPDGVIKDVSDVPIPTSPVNEKEKPASPMDNVTPVRRRYEKKDSDSGISSTTDNSSIDLNLSISSFISKSKEAGSTSQQVRHFLW